MSMTERHGMGGRLQLLLFDCSGVIHARRQVHNHITAEGKLLLARYFTGEVHGKPKIEIAVGSDGRDPSEADTGLISFLDKVAATAGKPRREEKEDGTIQVVAAVKATLPAIGEDKTQELREAGILIRPPNNDAVLYNRATFGVVTRTGNMEITLNWEVMF